MNTAFGEDVIDKYVSSVQFTYPAGTKAG
jgi:hypothetical protein